MGTACAALSTERSRGQFTVELLQHIGGERISASIVPRFDKIVEFPCHIRKYSTWAICDIIMQNNKLHAVYFFGLNFATVISGKHCKLQGVGGILQ